VAQIRQRLIDGGQPSVTPVVLYVPLLALGDFVGQLVTPLLAGGRLPGGASHVALEVFDVFASPNSSD
jgi:hypothetical protein